MKKSELLSLISYSLENVKIFDIHTHLFPPEHKNFFLMGIDELLNYHYLIAELFVTSDINVKKFNSLTKKEKAEIVWNELFVKRTPISEACKGILTILKNFSITFENKNYSEVKAQLNKIEYKDDNIFKKSNITSVVMTNNPFDLDEWSLFNNPNWDRKKYRASLRLDNLINEFDKSLNIAQKSISSKSNTPSDIIEYLEVCRNESNPIYVALSLDNASFKNLLISDFWFNVLEWLSEKKLPMSLMLGVKRRVNKDFGEAGDGIGDIELKDLSKLCSTFPNNKFLVTCLSLKDQHELTVLGRKHPNLKIFGFWWFMNQPSIIKPVLKMRIDLLGLAFIAQHSDARITDQLIYKWSHFKKILSSTLHEYYEDLLDNNFLITKDIIQRDVDKLLNSNAKDFLSVD